MNWSSALSDGTVDVRALASKFRVRSRTALARRFGIDTRALAALRISLGLLLLADLLVRSRDLAAHYTDAGALPRTALYEQFPGFAQLSLHIVSGTAWVQAILFLVASGFALALLLGYRTTLVTFVSFVLLVSLQARNPVLLNAGDSILRRLLFWSLFLPLGERWSVDSLRNGRPRERVVNVASAALLLQVVLVYTTNAVLKLRGDLWVRGDAILYVFSLDQLTILLGDVLANYPTMLRLFDRIWLVLVLTSILLVLLTGWSRAAFASLFVGMHLGMLVTMRLGLFPLISMASLLPFLPGVVWKTVERYLSSLGRRFDMTGWRNRFDRLGRHDRPDRPNRLAPERSRFGIPPSIHQWKRRLVSAAVAIFLTFILVWNAAALGYADLPESVDSTVDPSERRWDMFAPEPRGTDGWYVVPGRLESGDQIDALQQSPVRWSKPPDVAGTFPSHRWLVYLLDLRQGGNADLHPHFADYLCHRWNTTHEDDLVDITVYYVEQPTRLDGPEPTYRVELVQHSCSPA